MTQPSTPTVFSKPKCVQCDATDRAFTKAGHSLPHIDVTQDPAALEFILALDYQQAPVVWISPEIHWSGFRPDLINQHFPKENAA